MCFLCLAWTYFRLPEPKGRTYGEIDILFERRVPARKFRETEVDEFSGHSSGSAAGDTGGLDPEMKAEVQIQEHV
jgi:SP family general alpha glucoside:H+ symporter-like MFS transporter